MAVLNLEKVINIIEKPYLSGVYDVLIEKYKHLNAHVNGVDYLSLLQKIEGKETAKQLKARRQSAISNRDIVRTVTTPMNKIFSAKGGSRYYNLPESSLKEFRDILSNISGRMFSVKEFNETIWLNKYKTDPNGVIFFEIPLNDTKPYPCYKPITSILDYKSNGQRLDYIIFHPIIEDNKRYYRVVDDERDFYILKENNEYKGIDSFKFKGVEITGILRNPWGYVPGYVISDLEDDFLNIKKSPLDEIVELLDRYLEDRSVRNIFKHKFGFPDYWFYAQKCSVCNGTKYVDGKVCWSCGGSGYSKSRDVTDGIALKPPTSSDQPKIAPDLSGFSTPPITSLDAMKQDLVDLKKEIEKTLWGSNTKEDSSNETATAAFLNVQPVHDALNKMSKSANRSETFMTNILGDYHFPKTYKGCSIKNGTRYVMESPDIILKELGDLKNNNIPEQIQLNKIEEYIEDKFSNDFIEVEKQKTILKITPYPLKSVEDIMQLDIPLFEKQKKIYFGEWMQQLPAEDIIFVNEKKLKDNYNNWLIKKIKNEEKN